MSRVSGEILAILLSFGVAWDILGRYFGFFWGNFLYFWVNSERFGGNLGGFGVILMVLR